MGLDLGGLILVTVLVSAALATLLVVQQRSGPTPGGDASADRRRRLAPVRVRTIRRS